MPSSARFLGVLDPPENKENHETTSFLDELDESDVVWSSYTTTATAPISESYSPSPLSISSSSFSAASSTSPRQFLAPAAGLSVAIGFSDRQSRSPVVQRKKMAVSPLLSAAVSTVFAPPSPSTSPISGSAPVKVPVWADSRRIGKAGRGGYDPTAVMGGFDEGSDDGKMVPPHEIVARSHRTTTFSVFEGVGRTLKGRDLTRARDDDNTQVSKPIIQDFSRISSAGEDCRTGKQISYIIQKIHQGQLQQDYKLSMSFRYISNHPLPLVREGKSVNKGAAAVRYQ